MTPRRSRQVIAMERRERRNQADLDACECVDLGHYWNRGNITRKQKGKLAGLPVRQQVCQRCDSVRDQTLTWNGRSNGTSYDLSDDYITAARALDSDMHERKRVYRQVLIERALGQEAQSA